MSITPPPPLPSLPPRPPGERRAIVYVLADHVDGRAVQPAPTRNAAERDLIEIYGADRLARYPVVRDRFESRLLRDAAARRGSRKWAADALDAIHREVPVPGRPRLRLEQVLRSLVDAGPLGVTRREVCKRWGSDGGQVSGALTALHDCGVAFPLDGVRR